MSVPLVDALEEVGIATPEQAERLRALLGGHENGRPPSPLTEREAHILRCLAEGMPPKKIAADLGLSHSTVRSHLHVIYRKLDAVSGAQAVLLAAARGWI